MRRRSGMKLKEFGGESQTEKALVEFNHLVVISGKCLVITSLKLSVLLTHANPFFVYVFSLK